MINQVRSICFLLVLSFSPTLYSVEVYFNLDPKTSYIDPYRQIERPGHNFEEIMIEQIMSAEKSIHIAVQEFRLPLLAQAVVQRHLEGLEVKIIIDQSYNNTVLERMKSNRSKSLLNQEEIYPEYELATFPEEYEDYLFLQEQSRQKRIDPALLVDAIELFRLHEINLIDNAIDGSLAPALMHHKFIVIDQKKVVVTSANFTLHDVHGSSAQAHRRGNANALLVIDDKNIAQTFFEEFAIMYGLDSSSQKSARPRFRLNKPYRGVKDFKLEDVEISLQFAPTSRSLPYEMSSGGLIKRTIEEAEYFIGAALWVFSDAEIGAAMKQQKFQNFVNVTLVSDRLFAFQYYSRVLDSLGLSLLSPHCNFQRGHQPWPRPAQSGVMVAAPGDKLHHKFGVVDDHTVIFGSQNWTISGNHSNDETLMVIRSERIAREFKREFYRLIDTTQWGAPEWVQDRIMEREMECAQLGPIPHAPNP